MTVALHFACLRYRELCVLILYVARDDSRFHATVKEQFNIPHPYGRIARSVLPCGWLSCLSNTGVYVRFVPGVFREVLGQLTCLDSSECGLVLVQRHSVSRKLCRLRCE